MFWYIVKRFLLLIPIMLCVILVIYALMYNSSGVNRGQISSQTGDGLDKVFARLEIEETFIAKYVRFCYDMLFKGILGTESFVQTLARSLKMTIKLTLLSFVAVSVFGIGLGVACALNHDKLADNLITSLFAFMSAMPSYALSLLLVLLFAVKLRVLPVSGMSKPGAFVLPILTLSAGGISSTARLARSSMLDVLSKPYVTVLRAYGIWNWQIVFGKILKNALLPIVANINKSLSQLLCGTIVVEYFFSLPGLGMLLLDSIQGRNQCEVMSCGVVIAFLVALVSIATDLVCMIVNPQLRDSMLRHKGE